MMLPRQTRFTITAEESPQPGDIRSWGRALASRCNWGWLAGSFGPTITPSDIDFIVERRGQFLVGEIKPSRAQITQGQDIMLRALASDRRFTVFYLVGDIAAHEIAPKELLVLNHGEERDQRWEATSRNHFYQFCNAWFLRVDATGRS